MALEKRWVAVPLQSITSNGTSSGHIGVPDARLFHVKQTITLFSDDVAPNQFEIKRINSANDIELGGVGQNIQDRSDLSLYFVSDNAKISADEQPRNTIRPEHLTRAAFQEEPASAWRTMLVDPLGDYYGDANPLPISFDGTVEVGQVRITAEDGDPLTGDIHSSVRIGDGANEVKVNSDGSLNVVVENSSTATLVPKTVSNEVTLVAIGATSLVVSYTVPPATDAFLERISMSGDSISTFRILVNGTDPLDTKRLYWGSFNATANFESSAIGHALEPGDVVTVTAENNSLSSAGSFEARIQLVEKPV